MYNNGVKFKNGFFNEGLVPQTFSRLINDLINEAGVEEKDTTIRPRADVSENETHYFIDLSLPGLKKEDISIEQEDRKLKISGNVEQSNEVEGVKYHVRERVTGHFAREFRLPANANVDTISASFINGVLKVNIEKAQPERKNIEVK